MARKLTMGDLIDVVEAVLEAEYGGFQNPVAKRVVIALNDEGVFDPTQVEGWESWTPADRTSDTDDATQRLARAAFAVDSKHHFHEGQDGRPTCSCGFVGDARKRTQTEHITAAMIGEYDHD